MHKIRREISVEITITPIDAARTFCEFDATQQAQFFNEIAAVVAEWKNPFPFQLQYITDNKYLTDAGRAVMRQVGEYAAARILAEKGEEEE